MDCLSTGDVAQLLSYKGMDPVNAAQHRATADATPPIMARLTCGADGCRLGQILTNRQAPYGSSPWWVRQVTPDLAVSYGRGRAFTATLTPKSTIAASVIIVRQQNKRSKAIDK